MSAERDASRTSTPAEGGTSEPDGTPPGAPASTPGPSAPSESPRSPSSTDAEPSANPTDAHDDDTAPTAAQPSAPRNAEPSAGPTHAPSTTPTAAEPSARDAAAAAAAHAAMPATDVASATPPFPPREPERTVSPLGPLRAIGWLFAFGILVAGILVGAVVYRMVTPEPEPEQVVRVVRESPDVIVAVRDLARLQTAEYHVERVIDMSERQSRFFGLVDTADEILLVAAADVTAGVDLTRMADGDIMIEPDERRATITLPHAEIFSAHLDNERTYVHTRNTGALAARSDHLETQARREAESSLRASAEEAGILERAETNAERAIATLVRSLGYDEVVVRFADDEPADDSPDPDVEIATQ